MKPIPLLLALASLATAAPLPVAIGTATGSGKGEGIYLTTFDPETGDFGEVKLGAKYENPVFLATHPTLPLLYAAVRPTTPPRSAVAAFKIGETLDFLGEHDSSGTGPCHVEVDPTGRLLAVANYGDGHNTGILLKPDGTFERTAFALKADGKGTVPGRQDGPHSHGTYFRGGFLHSPDLGLDQILTFRLDLENGGLASTTPATWSASPGDGPRRLAFSPDQRHAYLINELSNTVTACRYDAAAGTFETIASLSTLPVDWTGGGTAGEIEAHPNGRFVYASNRGHDSIAVYSRDPERGTLTLLEIVPCEGKTPRHFAIAPGGGWIVCGLQDSGTLAALRIDPATGIPAKPASTAPCPAPLCILFLPSRD